MRDLSTAIAETTSRVIRHANLPIPRYSPSLPLDCPRLLRCNIVGHAVDAAHLIDDAVGDVVLFTAGNPNEDAAHDRQPLWFLDVPDHLRSRRGRGDPARAGRPRWQRDLLDRVPAAEAGTKLRLPGQPGWRARGRDPR